MGNFIGPFFGSLFFVFIAEMGDKTQLVALSFACKYKAMQVLAGVTIATLLVHILSAVIGVQLGNVIPLVPLKVIVGISFVAFGLWTLKGDEADDESANKSRYGAIVTVAIAFFLAELGDKTMLATISLAANYKTFLPVWLGSTAGMVLADGLAVIVGTVAGKRLPENIIKYVSAAIFIIAGIAIALEALTH